tara:strand:+ start:44 stop:463 length:420 start_codon:yes stop_codon:yes gene_type:complete
MLYLYTLFMLAWDLDKDTHACFREYLQVFINKRRISKGLRDFVLDTQSLAETLHLRPWPFVADNFIALRLGLSYRVDLRAQGAPAWLEPGRPYVVLREELVNRRESWLAIPILINKIHPPKYCHNAKKLRAPWNRHTNP